MGGIVRAIVLLVVGGLCGGCMVGAGAAAGYGTKRGFYAGVSVEAGISDGGVAFEVGGTSHGAITHLRAEAELNRGRFSGFDVDKQHAAPALRGGFGGAYSEGQWHSEALIGPEVVYRVGDKSYCEGVPFLFGGVEYRRVAGESQFVLTSHVEQVSEPCLN